MEVNDGDVLAVRVNGAQHLVGAALVVRGAASQLLLSDLMFRLVPAEGRVLPGFLGLLLNSIDARRQIRMSMRGSSGQFQLPQSAVKALRVPDVPLEEQRQVVAAHAAFERRITALERVLSKLAVAEQAIVAGAMAAAPSTVPLGSWLERIEAGKSPLAEDTPAGDAEWGVLKVSAVQAGWFKAAENKVIRDSGLINPQYEVRSGDLLMTRANTEALVGLACIAHTPPPRLMLSDKTLRLVPNEEVADPGFIELALLSPRVRSQVKARATGTSASMKNISQAAVHQLLVPNVPTEQQRDVVEAVRVSRKRAEATRRQIAKLRSVQQGVVEDLLAGRVRVPEVASAEAA
ncbi:hypothetical protein OG819_04780 [Streptomyces sp. NBC_01549]|uniref:restriction endonuclease subunit S n=1 Tax=Streptomyces sp. NBC_01549 TaxID=2975874 RepID=UPI00225A8925|nr:hypothetical protein [Streptomyces sp. NBC_01549]MCX4589083.1 hypothetical protein [Streptomyces sp. NBC_01549]